VGQAPPGYHPPCREKGRLDRPFSVSGALKSEVAMKQT
jgi:hypothetical protein